MCSCAPFPSTFGGGWKVELNNETLPKVLVNQEYANIVMNAHVEKSDMRYLNDRLASANWLVRALDQRAQTILKVASEIIERCKTGFFFRGRIFKTAHLARYCRSGGRA